MVDGLTRLEGTIPLTTGCQSLNERGRTSGTRSWGIRLFSTVMRASSNGTARQLSIAQSTLLRRTNLAIGLWDGPGYVHPETS
jgi:hypothetical protein